MCSSSVATHNEYENSLICKCNGLNHTMKAIAGRDVGMPELCIVCHHRTHCIIVRILGHVTLKMLADWSVMSPRAEFLLTSSGSNLGKTFVNLHVCITFYYALPALQAFF